MHSINGLVVTPAEAAISGVKVVATIGDKTLEATTDAQGKFAFEDLEKAGTYTFALTANERMDASAEVVIPDDKQSHNESLVVVMDKKKRWNRLCQKRRKWNMPLTKKLKKP